MKHFIQDGHSLVLRSLRKLVGTETVADATTAAVQLVIEEIGSKDWASATFVGQLHRVEARLEGEAGAVGAALLRVRDGIAECDAGTGAQFIAEAALVSAAIESLNGRGVARIVIDALTLEA